MNNFEKKYHLVNNVTLSLHQTQIATSYVKRTLRFAPIHYTKITEEEFILELYTDIPYKVNHKNLTEESLREEEIKFKYSRKEKVYRLDLEDILKASMAYGAIPHFDFKTKLISSYTEDEKNSNLIQVNTKDFEYNSIQYIENHSEDPRVRYQQLYSDLTPSFVHTLWHEKYHFQVYIYTTEKEITSIKTGFSYIRSNELLKKLCRADRNFINEL